MRLDWISSILEERFGHKFYLTQVETQLCFYLPGFDEEIVFDALCPAFLEATSSFSCTIWDAKSEGWDSPLLQPLPAPGLSELPFPLIEKTPRGFLVHYDILGLTYWMLTRQEEVRRTDLDVHGRFPATASHAFKYGYLERPIVDEWLHVLGQVICKAWPGLKLRTHDFSMKVSHDVDSPSHYGFRSWPGIVRNMGGYVLKHGDVSGALRAAWIRLNTRSALYPKDPANTFSWIMDVSERIGLTSAFYFICGRSMPGYDANYEPEHPAIRSLMRHVHARGHEIGLHPSYGSYRKPDVIKAESDRLCRIAEEEGISLPEWGGRMHYLRWEQPTTLRACAAAGMNYDNTLSYADRAGFRCGTCFEYPAFDPVAGEALALRVRPLIAMECTVMDQVYMGLGIGEEARAKFLQLKEACRAVNGCFTLLWHNTQLESKAKRDLYEAVLH